MNGRRLFVCSCLQPKSVETHGGRKVCMACGGKVLAPAGPPPLSLVLSVPRDTDLCAETDGPGCIRPADVRVGETPFCAVHGSVQLAASIESALVEAIRDRLVSSSTEVDVLAGGGWEPHLVDDDGFGEEPADTPGAGSHPSPDLSALRR